MVGVITIRLMRKEDHRKPKDTANLIIMTIMSNNHNNKKND